MKGELSYKITISVLFLIFVLSSNLYAQSRHSFELGTAFINLRTPISPYAIDDISYQRPLTTIAFPIASPNVLLRFSVPLTANLSNVWGLYFDHIDLNWTDGLKSPPDNSLHDINLQYESLGLQLGFRLQVHDANIFIGVNGGVCTGTEYTIDNNLTDNIPDASSFVGSAFLGIGYDFPLSKSIFLSPEIVYSFLQSSLNSDPNNSIDFTSFKIHTTFKFIISPEAPMPPPTSLVTLAVRGYGLSSDDGSSTLNDPCCKNGVALVRLESRLIPEETECIDWSVRVFNGNQEILPPYTGHGCPKTSTLRVDCPSSTSSLKFLVLVQTKTGRIVKDEWESRTAPCR